MAGALGVGTVSAVLAMGLASGVWYGLVCWLAFRAGADADVLLSRIAAQQRNIGLFALGIVIVVASIFFVRRRRTRSE